MAWSVPPLMAGIDNANEGRYWHGVEPTGAPRPRRRTPVPAHHLISRSTEAVKARLTQSFESLVTPLLLMSAEGALSPADCERKVWDAVLQTGRMLLGQLLGLLCRKKTEDALAAQGMSADDVWFRMDARGHGTQMTTLGEVSFPWFAYRETRGGATKAPAKALFPLHGATRSSLPCLEWAAALGHEHPFRTAQNALSFFTHGAVTLEDTTIERHAVAAGKAVTRDWQFRPQEEFALLLATRATRHKTSDRPLLYASTDAHMLNRYTDDTWKASWKAVNGVRLWCVDRDSGKIIHLGGEYTWGDCEEVASLFLDLRDRGLLPTEGGDQQPQLVLVSDGARWIEERVYPLFPGALLCLDAWHLLERGAKAANDALGAGSKRARQLQARISAALGLGERTASAAPRRKGHKKRERRKNPVPLPTSTGSVDDLFRVLRKLRKADRAKPAIVAFAAFIDENAYRMNYAELRRNGVHIGSGAMESMHRFGSQVRLKRSGCRWLAGTAQAILNLRMLSAVGRWEEFWRQPGLDSRLAATLAG